jgi:hypothetical protein
MRMGRWGARARGRAGAAVVALALIAFAAGCAPAPSPARPGTSRSMGPPPSGPPATSPATDPPDVPALLLSVPTGLAVTAPWRPTQRLPVSPPPGAWQPTAAVGPHGTILLVSAAARSPTTALEGVLTGTRVKIGWTVSLPAEVGPAVLAGCVAADGTAAVMADRLVYLRAGRVAGMHEVPATAGRCQMTDDDVVAYLTEVDHALALWSPGAAAAIVTATRCDDVGLGGGLLACLVAADDGVVVGRLLAPVGGRAAVDPGSVQRLPGPARQVVLSPDGQWLALAGTGATITLYRHSARDAFEAVGAFDLGPGDALLGFVEP